MAKTSKTFSINFRFVEENFLQSTVRLVTGSIDALTFHRNETNDTSQVTKILFFFFAEIILATISQIGFVLVRNATIDFVKDLFFIVELIDE